MFHPRHRQDVSRRGNRHGGCMPSSNALLHRRPGSFHLWLDQFEKVGHLQYHVDLDWLDYRRPPPATHPLVFFWRPYDSVAGIRKQIGRVGTRSMDYSDESAAWMWESSCHRGRYFSKYVEISHSSSRVL